MPPKPRERLLDAYQILGTSPSVSWAELRHRYRTQARQLHPDVQAHRPSHSRLDQSQAHRQFHLLQEAWSLVATPERRAEYDLRRRGRLQPAATPVRPPRPPAWGTGPRAGVLLRSGPGELHIAVPGEAWDLSLEQFLARARTWRVAPLLIGDLPPHLPLRQALSACAFVERHRLKTMVGLEDPAEERDRAPRELDDEGAWKLEQLRRAFDRWARAFPGRRQELPYASELLLMGRLSLSGYEINLPHPAGLHTLLEPRAWDRQETRRRAALPVLELRLPPTPLLLLASWAEDHVAQSAWRGGFAGLCRLARLDQGERDRAARALEARRGRLDGYEGLPGGALDGALPPPGLMPLLEGTPRSLEWLRRRPRALPPLPWGEPVSRSGEDRYLSDAASRLGASLVGRLLSTLPARVELVAQRHWRLRFRVGSVAEAEALLLAAVVRATAEQLGFEARPEVVKA